MTEQSAYPRFWQVAVGIALLLFFAALAFSLTMPITDPDFWWHLASGRWMWQERSLLQTDPFMIPYASGTDPSTHFFLKQYWLAQIIFYGAYALGGFHAIIILRAVLATFMFFCLYKIMRDEGASRFVALFFVYLSSVVIITEFGYVGDKPQLWSSLLSVLTLSLLAAVRRKKPWSYWFLPFLMVLWANLHGGYVFGIALIMLYAFGVSISRSGHRAFYLSCLAAILLSGLNPNGYNAVFMVFRFLFHPEGRQAAEFIVELQPLFTHASFSGIIRSLPALATLWGLVIAISLLSFAFLWREKKWLLIPALFTVPMTFSAIRYQIFFVTLMSILAAAGLGNIQRWNIVKRITARIPGKIFIGLLLTCIMIFYGTAQYLMQGYQNTGFRFERPYDDTFGGAVQFIKGNGLRGRLFNEYNKGGYLIWWLWPEITVASDTRGLMNIFPIYRMVSDNPMQPATPGSPSPIYEQFLDYHQIGLVLMSGCDPISGVPIFLSYVLLQDPRWALIYTDSDSLLFMKDTTGNHEFVERHTVSHENAYKHMIGLAERASRNPHARMVPGWRLSLAIGYQGIGDREKALFFADEYLKIRPADGFALQLRSLITSGSFALP